MKHDALLDKLSEFLMVEQCGWQLYRVVGSRATDPELVERYRHFGPRGPDGQAQPARCGQAAAG